MEFNTPFKDDKFQNIYSISPRAINKPKETAMTLSIIDNFITYRKLKKLYYYYLRRLRK